MKRALGRLVLLAAVAGAAAAALGYLRRTGGEAGSVQIVFDDGSTREIGGNSVEGQEFIDIARRLVETGV